MNKLKLAANLFFRRRPTRCQPINPIDRGGRSSLFGSSSAMLIAAILAIVFAVTATLLIVCTGISAIQLGIVLGALVVAFRRLYKTLLECRDH